MKKSIFYKTLYICIIVLIISGGVSAFILQSNYEQSNVSHLQSILTTASKATSSMDASYISSLTGGHRITIIDTDGNVISDSSVDEPMENHILRPEISAALNGDMGVSKRISSTMDTEMMYVAINNGDVIYRIAIEISGVDASFIKLLPAIIAGILVAGIVAVFLSKNIVDSAVKPLIEINESLENIYRKDYENVNLPTCKYDEINSITNAIGEVVSDLCGYIENISRQNDKMDFILNNMAQGLVLVDEESKIIHCNRFSSLLFGAADPAPGKDLLYLTRDKAIVESVNKVISSDSSLIFDITMGDYTYSVFINPIHASWQKNGALIMITDVTQDRSRQKLRQQFVANASHDLKTPITSIGGFAELLVNGLVKGEEKQEEYLQRIVDQCKYMQDIISDLLELSELDEMSQISDPPVINAYEVCKDVKEELNPMAQPLNLHIDINGSEDITVKMRADHFKKVISELMTNAIKYNKENGCVNIDLSSHGEKTKITISDTGCGINPMHIPRLFERFYREDKSRNSRIPGTGLGLSIVKHIVSIYGGSIDISSTKDESTVFTIIV